MLDIACSREFYHTLMFIEMFESIKNEDKGNDAYASCCLFDYHYYKCIYIMLGSIVYYDLE